MSPWRDPRTGVYYFRKRTPVHLRDQLGWELKRSLDTKDLRQAKQRWPHVAAQMQRQLDHAQRVYEEQQEQAAIVLEDEDYEQPDIKELWKVFLNAMTHDELRDAFLSTLTPEQRDLWNRMERRFAVQPVAQPAAQRANDRNNGRSNGKPVTLDQLLDLWAAATKPSPRTVSAWRGQVQKFIDHIGHADIARMERDDVQGYLDELLQTRAPKTVSDVRTILNVLLGFAEERGVIPDNPVRKIKVRAKAKAIDRVRPYNDDEAKAIIEAARSYDQDSVLRHAPNLLRTTGMRVEELAGLRLSDVKSDAEGYWLVLEDHDRRTLKNSSSARLVPLSATFTDPEFLAFVERRRRSGQPDDLLWTDVTADRFGRLGPKLTKRISGLVRRAGVTDSRTAPSHSWRHRAADKMREAPGMSDELRHRLLGHTSGNVGSRYGSGFSLASLRAAIDRVDF